MFFGIYPCFVFSDFLGLGIWGVCGLIWVNFQSLIVLIVLSFFPSSGIPIMCMVHLCNSSPQSLDISSFCSVFFSLIFSFEVSYQRSSSSEIPSSSMHDLISPQKAFFLLLQCSWSPEIFCCCSSFGFLSVCSHCPSVLACYLPYHQNS